MIKINLKAFYDAIRARVGLTPQNVEGFDKVLGYAVNIASPLNRQRLAYVIATAFWESGRTMHPVREAYWKDEEWRRRNLRYYPFYGRGLVQTTWDYNYEKLAKLLGLASDFFLKNPDKLLEWAWALPALFVGMVAGLYTGKDLDDFIDDVDEPDSVELAEYKAARKIVNGTDKAAEIAALALVFEAGLGAAGYPQSPGTQQPGVDTGLGAGGQTPPEPPAAPQGGLQPGGSPAGDSGSTQNPNQGKGDGSVTGVPSDGATGGTPTAQPGGKGADPVSITAVIVAALIAGVVAALKIFSGHGGN